MCTELKYQAYTPVKLGTKTQYTYTLPNIWNIGEPSRLFKFGAVKKKCKKKKYFHHKK